MLIVSGSIAHIAKRQYLSGLQGWGYRTPKTENHSEILLNFGI